MSRLAVVTGDTPIIALDLTDQDSGLVVDLSNAATTIAFKVRVVGSTTLKATVAWYLDNRDWWEPLRRGATERLGLAVAGA